MRAILPILTLSYLTSLICGCGGGDFEVAPAQGKVTCGGTPLTSGTIVFTPVAEPGAEMPGKAALGAIKSDGTFVLTTYEEGDGAIVGKHVVSYMPDVEGEGEDSDEEDDGESSQPSQSSPVENSKSPCRFGGKAASEVEIVSGDNDLTVELSPWNPAVDRDDDSGLGE